MDNQPFGNNLDSFTYMCETIHPGHQRSHHVGSACIRLGAVVPVSSSTLIVGLLLAQ